MKYISLFSGIEAASVAWRSLGWTPLAFAEIEPFPCAVLAHHFPDVPNHGDVTAFDWSVYRGECDLLVGGSPCQSFSVAGLRGSLSDDRGNLALAFCKITHAINPRFVVYENVPGILSTADNAFGCLLAGLVGSSDALASGLEAGRWPDAGMVIGPVRSAAWRVLDAQGAIPQRRRRVFVVSCRVSDGINPGAVLFEPEASLVECLGNWDRAGSLFSVASGLRRDLAPSREAGPHIASSLTRGDDSSGKGGYAGRRREDDTNIVGYGVSGHAGYREGSGTLRAHGGDRGGDLKYSSQVAGCLNSGGNNGGFRTEPGEHLIGVNNFGEQDVATSLSTSNQRNDGDTETFVVGATLRKGNGNETGGVPFIAHAVQEDNQNGDAIAFDEAQITSNVNRTRAESGLPASTISKASRMTVAFQERGRADGPNVDTQTELAYSLTAPNGGGRRQEMNILAPTLESGECSRPLRKTLHAGEAGEAKYQVRRLSVVECSRLQAFPDTYLHSVPMRPRKIEAEDARYLIGHGVECWQDDGQWMTRCPSDGGMYRALGNSMCTAVVAWIGRRIMEVENAK